MVAKSPTSTYSLGTAMIRSDKPTVAKLKVAAAAEDMTLAEYIRNLANMSQSGQQGQLVSGGTARDLYRAVDNKLNTLTLAILDTLSDPVEVKSPRQVERLLTLVSWLSGKDFPGYAESRRPALEAKLKQYEAELRKEAGQVELKGVFNYGQ